jgi:Domain of unknown function (DUF397)
MAWRKSTFSETGQCVEAGNWRKASFSLPNNACVEAADWRKTKYSIPGGNCVEVASGVAVRDTQDRDGVTLQFTAAAWQQFTQSLR